MHNPRHDDGNHRKTQEKLPNSPDNKNPGYRTIHDPPTPGQIKEIFPKEVPATQKLYLDSCNAELNSQPVFAAVFPGLHAGDYDILVGDATPVIHQIKALFRRLPPQNG
jgi:hypothetical protein